MSSLPPVAPTADQRLLAAIVFTDVAGFSRRVQVEEAVTLKLLERDFVTMRAFCGQHSGRVIKSTGDGLLLFFASAVHAVEWALKTQRHFADQAADLPPTEVLRHRVGVHLGDVLLADGDVMGDGVNVAARVQAASPPGGICISQEVFGVVKNKMKLDVIRLEPRQLKNINEPVQMYHVLLHAPAKRAQPLADAKLEETPAPEAPTFALKKWIAIGVGVLVAGGVTFALLQAHRDHQRSLAGSQDTLTALGAALNAQTEASSTSGANTAPAGAPTGGTTPAAKTTPASAPKYDFAKVAASRPAGATGEVEPARLQEANVALAALEAWRPTALRRFTKEQPLFVTPLRQTKLQSSTLYSDAESRIWSVVGGARKSTRWDELSIEDRGAIMAALVRYTPATPPEVMRGAEAFAWVHGLPEMAEMLLRERGGK